MKKNIVLLAFALIVMPFFYGCDKKTADRAAPAAPIETALADLPVMDSDEYTRIKVENQGKIVVFNFFASWCPPCVDEMPDFVKTYNEYKNKNFTIIGVSADREMKDAVKFVKRFNIEFPVYFSDKKIEKKYLVTKYPTSFVYDKQGKLLRIINGAISGEDLKAIAEMGR